ncbi:S41 family peptidase [Aquimarina sp. ERC-38]|uniref:S41 family peptidase n=1 Tax=Aquimarina sp. ERC-38 TaxID=2949996 RepID=UPI002245E7AE|nr:S41 family peptidase [Aquimarina sp. ERC-38]UZO79780.1 S41 family peptidase [Aquimarina sp. ERC-38]
MFTQEGSQWLRFPAISPDGKTIAFGYQGDIYTVPSTGGKATILTISDSYDRMPIWSPDGSQIAFASNRYGNFDVFIMPSKGGISRRLTFHSSNDSPSDFSPDGNSVLFSSSRLDLHTNQLFPSSVLPELYQVPTKGGRVQQVITTPAVNAKISRDGKTILFQDSKGYEDPLRKHHTSSVTRDIWKYNIESKTYTQLSIFNGEDVDPVFAKDGNSYYFLSESSGSFNVHKATLSGGPSQQISNFSTHPVRHLSIASNGIICYSYHGSIYLQDDTAEPQLLKIDIRSDLRNLPVKTVPVNDGLTEFSVSSNGKEIAFIKRGEVFVSSIKDGTTKRITNTPEQERDVSFSPDGKTVLYAGERDGSWNLYETSISRKEEKYFFNSTVLKEKIILNSDSETFQPSYSPDGKEVAFLEERTHLKVINLKSKEVREVIPDNNNYSYSDGDQFYEWSPDSKWFLVNYLREGQWIDQAGLVKASGKEPVINIAPTGYGAYAPRWMMEGKMITWYSARNGMKNHGSWGNEMDFYGMFLTKAAWDSYNLTELEAELIAEEKKEVDSEDEKKESKDKKKTEDKEKEVDPISIELEGREDRISRLTTHSSHLGPAIVSKDGKTLYYLAKFEKGYNLWQTNLRTKATKILASLNAQSEGDIEMGAKEEFLYILSGGKLSKVDLKKGKVESISVKGEMSLNEMSERAYLAEHIWRQTKKKFYLKNMQGVDWDFYKKAYFAKLKEINNNFDFAELMSEMLGELNASHTGAFYRKSDPNGDQTASLGIFLDPSYSDNGLRIIEIMDKSPFKNKSSKAKPGHIIKSIDGVMIDKDLNYYPLLNRKAGKNVLITIYDPKSKKQWDEIVKPITNRKLRQIRYERWVKNCNRIVEKLSEGKLGYVHVQGMNDESFRKVYNDALGKHYNKEGLIVDTRFNGGGWLHDDLATFLNGKTYMNFRPRDQNLGSEPQFKWSKPSVVVMSESNYSDAHMFPVTYQAMGIGKLVGMPVPGTGTAVWWEKLQNGITFGIPMVGMLDTKGKYLENQQLEPDVKVALDPGIVITGRDQQLEAAIKTLLEN